VHRSPVPSSLLRLALCAALSLWLVAPAWADDPTPPPADPAPVADPTPTPAPAADPAPVADPTPTPAPAVDPSLPNPNEAIERVVSHIEALTKIIEVNTDQPDKAIEDFEVYLTTNAKAMRDANAAIEAKLKGLPADESQSYQEGMQRRLEDPLRKFMTAMLNFGRKHPEKAKALDEKLQRATL
jgi:hypothetical protein